MPVKGNDMTVRRLPGATGGPARKSAARDRILQAADSLFYREGIRAVGVERVISQACVTRVTFYRHFPSKDELIAAYLRGRLRDDQERMVQLRRRHPGDPRSVLTGILGGVIEDFEAPGFCGCAYSNLTAEYRDEAHPARAVAREHRSWLLAEVQELLNDLGVASPIVTAEQLVMLRAGAMAVASVARTETIAEGLSQTWSGVLDDAVRGLSPPPGGGGP
jgi:AcrR family transcriptional regulator